MSLNLTIIFSVLNALKIDHWQTQSFAEHKALGTAYEKLDDLFDTYIEHYYGLTGIPNTKTKYNISISSDGRNLISYYSSVKKEVVDYLQSVSDSGDLKNICDEIEGEFNHLLYRLNQK